MVLGEVIKIVNDELPFGEKMMYGFIKVKGIKENVFFNLKSSFLKTSFEELKLGDKVHISFENTSQGPFANTITLYPTRSIPQSKSLHSISSKSSEKGL